VTKFPQSFTQATGPYLEDISNRESHLAIRRELQEEIGFVPTKLRLLDCYDDQQVMRYVFCGALEIALEQLCLGEGLDMGFATIDEIQIGERFSPKTGRFHPLGRPHRQILLSYIKTIY